MSSAARARSIAWAGTRLGPYQVMRRPSTQRVGVRANASGHASCPCMFSLMRNSERPVINIARDGMLAGPNLALYRALCVAQPGLAVQASGGVRNVADVAAARDAGCAGAVLGKALLEGRLSLEEALAC